MATFEIRCEHCGSQYQLPVEMRDALRGSIQTCVVCMREWTPLPADQRGVLSDISPAWRPPSAIALHPYLQSNPYAAPGAPSARSTTQMIRPAPASAAHRLHVVAIGPGLELNAAFELGAKSFLIGRRGAHLDLPQASGIPDWAIRIRSAPGGFQFEGIHDFHIPLGPISVASGRIEAGKQLDLVLGPYRVMLAPTEYPGSPIADLEGAPAAAPAPPAPPRPAPPPAPAGGGDVNSTVRGLSTFGFDTRSYSNPLETVDVGFLGLDPPVAGETFWIRKSPTLLGRTTGDILIADSRVSGKHAQIDVLGIDQYAIKDLASTNGTTVNDRPASTTRLKDGDVIGLGGVRLRFVARAKKKG
jgi:hypothetical protein